MIPRILVIEDSRDLLADIVEMLSAEGFQVFAADNGQTGINLAKAEKPDLIVCDIRMPGMNGYGVLEEVRAHPQIMNTVFIFLTAIAGRENVREGMSLGADDYLTKPFTAEELISAVHSRLQRRDNERIEAEDKLNRLRQNISLALPHEMRTPLNAILGFSELLIIDADTLDKPQVLEMAGHIHHAGQRLFRLIENYIVYTNLEILKGDQSRLQQLQIGRAPEPGKLIAERIEEIAHSLEREGDLELDIISTRRAATISPDNLLRIVTEVADNAFKFSAPGETVHIQTQATNDLFQIVITDEGTGMKPEQIQSIGGYMQFDRSFFEQQGLGLGLTIARSMTETHGGTFEIDSVPDQYTRIIIYLPLADS